jgi:hypothetical protein
VTTTTLDRFAIDGVLPFNAYVEVREDGRWHQEAKGSTVAWLSDTAREEAAMFGQARIVSQFGAVLQEFNR